MASRSASALTALALAALNIAAVLTLGRVFASGRFALPVVSAVLLVHLLGFMARTRRWPLLDALSLWLSGLAVFLIWVLALHTTAYGLPTLDTFRVLADRLGDGFHELRTAVVPAPASDGAIVLCVLVAWVMAATSDALAFWHRATIGAIAAPLALFVWASTLGTDTLATGTTAGFIVAALVFLFVQHQSLLERNRTRFAGRRVRGTTGIWTFGALAGAAAVLGGLVLGPALPGADADPIVDVRGLGPSDRTYRAQPPLARIGADFVQRGRAEVFTVRSPREEYWRTAALDAYDSVNGGEWTLSAQGTGQVKEGLHAAVDDTMLRQEFHLTGVEDRWLPAAYQPVQLEGVDDPLVVQASTTLVSRHKDLKDVTYTVSSRLAPSSDSELTDAQRQGTNEPLPPTIQQYTALPDDFPADVRAKAFEITNGKGTPFDRARALEQFFLDPAEGFHYSLDVDLGPDAQTQSAIREFLQSRTGFCVQFAGSFAAMARAAGLPARVAVGYTPGLYDSTARVFRVTSEDAHAWAEVWLSGLGWTRFEPTPASDLPGGGRLPGRVAPPSGSTASTPPTSAPASVPTTSGASAAPGNTAEVAIDQPATAHDRGRGWTFSWLFVVALLTGALAGVVGVAAAIVAAKRRRRQRRRGRRDPAEAITGAWEEVLDRLDEAGVRRVPARTPLELAAHAATQLPEDAAPPLRDLAETYTAARYASAPPDRLVARAAWRDAGAVSSALRSGARLRERWRRRLDPTPLRR
ncbi:MAG TPA: transglutaminaseTgpA domain-containing protein [Acidimicrobiia bacterium]